MLRDEVPGVEIKTKAQQVCRDGEFLVAEIDAKVGGFGIVPKVLDGAIVSSHYFLFSINSALLDTQFLHYYLKTAAFRDQVAAQGSTNYAAIRPSHVLTYTVPLPPIDEQRRIVKRIEIVEAKIHSVSQIAAEAQMAEDKLWMILAHDIFSRLSDSSLTRLEEVVALVGGGTPSKGNPDYWNGAIPWVSPKDMKTRLICDSADHISESAIQGSAAKLIQPGAVLIVVRGMILAHTVPSAVLKVPATINQDMKALVPLEGLDPEFLSMYLWAFNRELLALVERSTHDTRKLETAKLLGFPVMVPPMDTQKAICGQLRELEMKVANISEHRRNAQREAEALLPSVLNQAFEGRL